jgi:hypothetical protein
MIAAGMLSSTLVSGNDCEVGNWKVAQVRFRDKEASTAKSTTEKTSEGGHKKPRRKSTYMLLITPNELQQNIQCNTTVSIIMSTSMELSESQCANFGDLTSQLSQLKSCASMLDTAQLRNTIMRETEPVECGNVASSRDTVLGGSHTFGVDSNSNIAHVSCSRWRDDGFCNSVTYNWPMNYQCPEYIVHNDLNPVCNAIFEDVTMLANYMGVDSSDISISHHINKGINMKYLNAQSNGYGDKLTLQASMASEVANAMKLRKEKVKKHDSQ